MQWKERYEVLLNDQFACYEDVSTYLDPYRPPKLYRYRNYGCEWKKELRGFIYLHRMILTILLTVYYT